MARLRACEKEHPWHRLSATEKDNSFPAISNSRVVFPGLLSSPLGTVINFSGTEARQGLLAGELFCLPRWDSDAVLRSYV